MINIPGTINDSPQLVSTKQLASNVPMILPIEVCEFQMPNINPKIRQEYTH